MRANRGELIDWLREMRMEPFSEFVLSSESLRRKAANGKECSVWLEVNPSIPSLCFGSLNCDGGDFPIPNQGE